MSLQLIFFRKTRHFQSHKATTSHQAMITQCTDRQMAPKKQKSASPEWLIFTTSCVRVRNSTPALREFAKSITGKKPLISSHTDYRSIRGGGDV